jgi:predicted aconitase with swiveling domain
VSAREPRAGSDLPLNERELLQLKRLLGDPFSYPPELWTWIKTRIEEDPPSLYSDAILGFERSSVRAVPAMPKVSIAVDVSANPTDLAGPGANYSSVWVINPGGGQLRSIGEPDQEGARITLKGGWTGNTILRHNDVGGSGRPLLLHGGANLTLTDTESIDLVYVDTYWQDVARVETVTPFAGLLTTLVTRTTPVALTGGTEQNLGWENEIRDDFAGWSGGQNHIIVPAAGVYLAVADLLFSGGSGGTIGSGLFMYRYSSGVILQEVLGRDFTPVLNSGASVSAVMLAAAADKIYVNGISGATGAIEEYTGRFSVTKLI